MKDVECPYCNKWQDPPEESSEPDELHECECGNCGKYFGFYVQYFPSYSSHQIPCYNGEPHDWRNRPCLSEISLLYDYYKCHHCEEEMKVIKGEQIPEKYKYRI
jgi:hypothetical protein